MHTSFPATLQQDIWFNKNRNEASLRGAWFYRTDDIQASVIRKLYGKKRKRDTSGGEAELFLSYDMNTNSSETVLKRVAVVYADDTDETIAAKKEWADRHGCETFVCNYFYRTRTERFQEFSRTTSKVQEEPMMTANAEKKILDVSTWEPDLVDVPVVAPVQKLCLMWMLCNQL